MRQEPSCPTPEQQLDTLRDSASYGLISWIFVSLLDCVRASRWLTRMLTDYLAVFSQRRAG